MTDHTEEKPSLHVFHTSDAHLTTPQSTERLAGLVDTANALSADLTLIAGDLFDSSRVSDETLERAMEELSRLAMPTVILPGNHDQLDDKSPYHRIDISTLGPSVHLITHLNGEQVRLPELSTTLWGRAMEDHSPLFKPLDGAPSRSDDGWHIGMAHGFHIAKGSYADRSSPILAEEIEAAEFDYLALGHVHVFRDVSEGPNRAAYSGAPDEEYHSEKLGRRIGHAALVHFDPRQGVHVEHVPVVRRVEG